MGTLLQTLLAGARKAVPVAAERLVGRLTSGNIKGFGPGDLTEESSPVAGHFLPGWGTGGALRKFDVSKVRASSGIAKHKVSTYDPSAAQLLTTTYADVAGSEITYTPVSASNTIVYKYNFHIAGDNTFQTTSHFVLQQDGVDVTESKKTFGGSGLTELSVCFTHSLPSWSGSKTLKLQGREFNATNATKLHGTRTIDGSNTLPGSEVLVRATLEIIEIEP